MEPELGPCPGPEARQVKASRPEGHNPGASPSTCSPPVSVSASDDESDVDVGCLPCDTLAAILLLAAEFRLTDSFQRGSQPVVLKSQLYSVVKDKTVVDREVEVLRHNGEIRCFKLGFGPDEYAILLAKDYDEEIRRCSSLGSQADAPLSSDVFAVFAEKVLKQVDDVCISRDALESSLREHHVGGEEHGYRADEDVAVLLKEGFLTRTSDGGQHVYNFWSPSVGGIVASVVKGRKEVVGVIKRKKRCEMLEKELLDKKSKLKQSTIGIKFHLRDLVGKGVLEQVETASGLVLRLRKGIY